MKLTDYVTAEDIYEWMSDKYSSGISTNELAKEIFIEHDKQLFDLRNMMAKFDFEPNETGAVLSFLDAAIRHKSKVIQEFLK